MLDHLLENPLDSMFLLDILYPLNVPGHSAAVGLSTAFPGQSMYAGLSASCGPSTGKDLGQSAGTASGISLSAAKHVGLSKKHPS